MKTFCDCGCQTPLTDYEYHKFSGYKREGKILWLFDYAKS